MCIFAHEKLMFKKFMCIFACLLNSRRKEITLLIPRIQRKNTLQDFLMSTFKETSKLNLESVGNFTLPTY